MYVMSVEKCKELDKQAIEILGIPGIVLMENAATEVTMKIKELEGKFIVVCGEGNNGGDGLAIARKLINEGKKVFIIVVGDKGKYSTDFLINLNILKNIRAEISYIRTESEIYILKEALKDYHIIVDSIFGVGLNREVNKFYKGIIDTINESRGIKVSIDVPSGLNANTGKAMGSAIKANFTYTFEIIKEGFIKYNALEYLGNLHVISIGIPNILKEGVDTKVKIIEDNEYKIMLRERTLYGHKGTYGNVAIVAGSKGYTGAAYLTTQACVNTGAGLTTLISTEYVQDIISAKIIEAMTVDINNENAVSKVLEKAGVIAIGPGLNSEDNVIKELFKDISKKNKFFVVDANGLDIIRKNNSILKNLSRKAIFTPHPGEMARLIGKSIEYVEENRIEVARSYAKENNIILLLKGYYTVITDGIYVYINNTGNSKMASGGMGDALTGIIASLIAQKHSLIEAACLGAYIHGLAGEKSGKCKYSTIASEVIEEITNVMNYIKR